MVSATTGNSSWPSVRQGCTPTDRRHSRHCARWPCRWGCATRTQANEQVDVAIAADRYGGDRWNCSARWGWLEPGVTVAHLCEITDGEIDMLATAAWGDGDTRPGCDVPMGWGIAPVASLLRAGVPVGMGTGGAAATTAVTCSPTHDWRCRFPGSSATPCPAAPCWGCVPRSSAQGLGRTDIGHLRPGAAADLCIWDCDDVFDAGVADRIPRVCCGHRPAGGQDVMVAGRWVVRDGHLVSDDSRAAAHKLTALIDSRSG